MKISSDSFAHNQVIPIKYTCDGDNVNPSLQISEIPSQAKSLVLVVNDPDAPSGRFIHWLLYNISPQTTLIEENSVPQDAQQALTSFGGRSYGGPCPPASTHHYHFKIFALDTELTLDSKADIEDVENAMEKHILDWSEIIGLYQRK
jgi:hypothetical protein